MARSVFSRPVAADLVDRWRTHDVPDLAAAIAYRTFVALLPLLLFLAGLGAVTAKLVDVEDPAQRLVAAMSDAAPDGDAAGVLEREVGRVLEGPGFLAVAAGFVGALWTGSLAVNTTVKWLNNIHEIEETRSTPRRWALNVGLTAGAGLLLAVSFFGFFALQLYGREITARIGLGEAFAVIFSAARWPVAFGLVVLAAAALYTFGPDKRRDPRWVSLGAITFGAVWLAATFAFGFYISRFDAYNATYGVLGAIFLLASWLYLTSLAFLFGAEIDAACATEVGSERRDALKEAARPGPDGAFSHAEHPPRRKAG